MKKIVAVLMGGLSGEREISILTGKACSKALKKKGYKVYNIDAKGYFISKLKKIKPKVIFNALHGKYGEDGFIQTLLESIKIPYTHTLPDVLTREEVARVLSHIPTWRHRVFLITIYSFLIFL